MDKQTARRIWEILLKIRADERGEPAEYDVAVKGGQENNDRLVRSEGAAGN